VTAAATGEVSRNPRARNKTGNIQYRWAINGALAEEMRRDEAVVLIGQDIGPFGGDFGVTRGLYEEFGAKRVVDTPISETAIIAAATGAAMAGLRPVVEMAFADFLMVSADEMFYKAAKWRYVHGDSFRVPLVVRAASGVVGGAGAEHSSSLEALTFRFPGVKAVAPSTPRDAKGMLKAAIREDNPVIFFEHKALYGLRGPVDDADTCADLSGAAVRRTGSDMTIASYGAMVHRSLEAAELLAAAGIEVEVIDLRAIVPLDHVTVLESVARTHRLLTVEEGPRSGGIGAELAARVQEEGLKMLNAPIRRLAGLEVPTPFSPGLEQAVIPSVDQIVSAVKSADG
jgi:acetoin:2,6-dichlorophenolindophenol oxidoreductase subunit beta